MPEDNHSGDVEVLTADQILLRAQGHKDEMPRQFGAFATLSLAFSLTNSWVGYSAVFATPLLAGGGPTMVFGLIAATIACSLITDGLAELSSAFPSSGGQYQYEQRGPKESRYIADLAAVMHSWYPRLLTERPSLSLWAGLVS